MLKIAGSAKLSFLFPADRITAYNYYSDMNRLVGFLKHIELYNAHTDQQFRLRYNTKELGTYHIDIYCDVRLDTPKGNHTIKIVPLDNLPAIKQTANITSTTGRGYYSSEATFRDENGQTRIDYNLKLHANLLRPRSMKLMLQPAINTIAKKMTNHRIKEIAEYFIDQSITEFKSENLALS